jgi:hypothetical protein
MPAVLDGLGNRHSRGGGWAISGTDGTGEEA